MFGFFINLLLVVIAAFELAWGIHIFLYVKEIALSRNFIATFTFFSVMICAGFGIMGIIPDVSKAYIPRFFGIWGCVALFLTEFSYILFDMNTPKLTQYIGIGVSTVWGIMDVVIYGQRRVNNYIHYDFYNTMETAYRPAHIFHYVFLGVLGAILLVLSVKWYKSKKIKREKRFVVHIIIANYIVLFATLPDIFSVNGTLKYPNIPYCLALGVNFFVWMKALKQNLSFRMSLKNVSEGIFYTIDVPVILFSTEGIISLYNPSAKEILALEDSKTTNIHDVLRISDVEEMRLFAKARHGENYELKALCYATNKMCLLKCSVKLDYVGEPYCIIGTILHDIQDVNNEERNI